MPECFRMLARHFSWIVSDLAFFLSFAAMSPISGGYGAGVPPLPIPNRAVKPGRADGTASQWESR